MTLLGPDGSPVSADASAARKAPEGATAVVSEPAPGPVPSAPAEAPIALEGINAEIDDGPITLRVKVEFKDVKVGGAERAKFMSAVNAVLVRTNAVGVRLIEMMLLAAGNGDDISGPLVGCVNDLGVMRRAIEEIMGRLVAGKPVAPAVEIATAEDMPTPAPAKAKRHRSRK